MAKVDRNSLLAAVSGSIGNLTIVRKKNGTVYVRTKSDKAPVQTASRKAQQSRLTRASIYASAALAAPESRAFYEAAARAAGRSVQNLAVQDHMNEPVIEEMDLSNYSGKKGESIRVVATDDLAVASLQLTICDLTGARLEAGDAAQIQATSGWVYTTRSEPAPGQIVEIEATAIDHAGNRVVKKLPHLIRN